MCGIAGFTGFTNNNALAKNANMIQKHRGPDHFEIWSDENISLAHRRLSIIDLSECGNQPLIKNNLIIVFNGEIYNYKELKQKLEKEKKVTFLSSSDTEVVLEMFQSYGTKCLDYFIGMFAFAIYDKTSKATFIARDHFGIKPLFYTKINNGFAFSSELKTLIKTPGFDKTINSKSLVSCLNYLWVSGNETMFQNCYKLPPAHYLLYTTEGGVQINKYWELNDKVQEKKDEKKIVHELQNTIESSVIRHMVADVPVSSFLSGGLDSSLISVIAKKKNKNLSTYTIGTLQKDKKIEQMPDDEKYADLVAKKFNLDHHVIQISPDILKEFPNMVGILDEPIGDPAAINTYLICKSAREKGVKVLLSGMGADEIFFGYRRQKATLIAARYNKLPVFIKNQISTIVQKLPVKIGNRGFKIGRWAKRFISFANLPIEEAYMRSYSYYSPEELKDLLNKEHSHAIDELREEHKELFYSKYKEDVINQICNVDIHMFMLGLNLTYSDRASMAASVEVRVPFIDKEVITKAMQIPGSLKIKQNISKYILKKAAEKFLPNTIIYRPKASFGAPLRSWISTDLKEMVDDLLSEESINKRGFLNYSFVKNLIQKDRNGDADYAYQIYQLLTLELWCREYLDSESKLKIK
ncbi:asparagine synthase (glutamine-hydrolyzing) [Hanamia caeni]|jgi:asparagine synthase (glutamine-hydrolysing)|uniref:asparagine synthase (glutamine-hydrolyzing) n=1 Tax=Hanamia caeni TaxID=2294116 RepID=A0A3M9NI82_9BACT|nr:asparagine synthase (glutamine-hydrolyzing) [Hanamia caeni]RNI37486.1 asparagine synthase (glutamine-hydrolyzing) [Hanamia caeni]